MSTTLDFGHIYIRFFFLNCLFCDSIFRLSLPYCIFLFTHKLGFVVTYFHINKFKRLSFMILSIIKKKIVP